MLGKWKRLWIGTLALTAVFLQILVPVAHAWEVNQLEAKVHAGACETKGHVLRKAEGSDHVHHDHSACGVCGVQAKLRFVELQPSISVRTSPQAAQVRFDSPRPGAVTGLLSSIFPRGPPSLHS